VSRKKLTAKEQEFCKQYLIDLNATQAAIRAGYSQKTANQIGSENLSKLGIQTEIEKLKNERSERTLITADRVLKEIALLAFSNIKDFVKSIDNQITVKDLADISDEAAACIAELSQSADGRIKIKLHNKDSALDKLIKHLGIDRPQVEMTLGEPDQQAGVDDPLIDAMAPTAEADWIDHDAEAEPV